MARTRPAEPLEPSEPSDDALACDVGDLLVVERPSTP